MRTIADASGDSLMAFLGESIDPAVWSIPTDGWATSRSNAMAIATK